MDAVADDAANVRGINGLILKHLRTLEMIGVLMRIFSFSLVSWLGPASPFLFVWSFNTADAILLSWCAVLKRDRAYNGAEPVLDRGRRGRHPARGRRAALKPA